MTTATQQTLSERIAAELELIAKRGGGVIKPERVVEFARNEKTALHSQFTWDDGEAAEAYRLWQARQVIRVCVRYVGENDDKPTRAYVSLVEDRVEGGYRPITAVMADAEMRESLLAQAKAEMKRWSAKYRELTELASVFAAIDQIE
jgi:prophage tail gpP-like protein